MLKSSFLLKAWLLNGLLMLVVGYSSAQTGMTYYVATTGNDSNLGTIGAPWRTIQHAANTVTAGATVDVRAEPTTRQ